MKQTEEKSKIEYGRDSDQRSEEGLNVICIGGTNMDYKMVLKGKMVKGTSNPVTSAVSYGGVIRNVAENLARLGIKTSLMSIVGDDPHGRNLINYDSYLMDMSEMEISSDFSTGSYSALLDLNGEMIIGMADMEISSLMNEEWIRRHENELLKYDFIAADCNIGKDAMGRLVELSIKNGKKLAIIGVSGPKTDRIPGDINNVTLGIFNRDETQAYFNTTEEDVEKLCKMWLEKGMENAIVTAGKDEVASGDKSGVTLTKVNEVKNVVDVTGAGDAFSAGVIYGQILKKPLTECVKLGMANSALNIQSRESVRLDLDCEKLIAEMEKGEKANAQ